jgi:hypothetical protein
VALLENGATTARAPRDEVVELAAIDGFPALHQRLMDGSREIEFHGVTSCEGAR